MPPSWKVCTTVFEEVADGAKFLEQNPKYLAVIAKGYPGPLRVGGAYTLILLRNVQDLNRVCVYLQEKRYEGSRYGSYDGFFLVKLSGLSTAVRDALTR